MMFRSFAPLLCALCLLTACALPAIAILSTSIHPHADGRKVGGVASQLVQQLRLKAQEVDGDGWHDGHGGHGGHGRHGRHGATVRLGRTQLNTSAQTWLAPWLDEHFHGQFATADVPAGLARSWFETANRRGALATVAEQKLLGLLGAPRAGGVPSSAHGMRHQLDKVLTPEECVYFQQLLHNGTDFDPVDHGQEASILPHQFPPLALERIRAAVSKAVAASSPVGSPLFASYRARGPVQFLSAQIILRNDSGAFGQHVDSSQWSMDSGCRVPVSHNSLSAYTTDIFLSDPNAYGDGEIEFVHPPLQALKRPQGDALLFASDVTNPHLVRPVRGGKRYALVIWWHDSPALAPAHGVTEMPDVSINVSPALEAASKALQAVSHLALSRDTDEWTRLFHAAKSVPNWAH